MTPVRLFISAFLILVCITSPAQSEKLTFFSARDAGADVWSWSAARAKASGDGIKIIEKNPVADYGDVFLTDRFPYFKDGEIDLDVEKTDGTYALQILTFKGGQYLESIDITKNSPVTGPQKFSLQGYHVPEGTEMITFKIWIGGEEASMQLNDLRYTVSINPESIVFDKKINTATTGKTDGVTWLPAVNGGMIRLEADQKTGSILFSDRMPVYGSKLLMLDAPEVKNGNITVQLPVFDSTGTYLSSVDIIKNAMSGFCSARLDLLEWPAQADTFEIKIWLGGTPEAEAQIKRIIVLK